MGDESARRSRIVYCRELDSGTVLHMTPFGDDYVFRRFDGSDPFDRSDHPSGSGMRVCYRFDYDRPLTDEESQHEVEDIEYWDERIATINSQVLSQVEGGHDPQR
jgi:hypothetical protein